MKQHLGILGLMIVTIIWGGGFVASDIALESATPFQILAVRFTLATLVMGIPAVKHLKHVDKKELRNGVILGTFLFVAFAFQTIGLQYTTPSKNAFLTATNVVMVPFIAYIILKKKASKQNLLGAVLAVIGAAVLSLKRDFTIQVGDALTLVGAVCFAFQIFLTGEYTTKMKASVLNFIQMATASVLSLLFVVLTGEGTTFAFTNSGVMAMLYLGIMSTAFCYAIQTIAQKYVDETKTAIILSAESVFGALLSVIILNEYITLQMLVGSVLILSAVLLSEIKLKRKKELHTDKEVDI